MPVAGLQTVEDFSILLIGQSGASNLLLQQRLTHLIVIRDRQMNRGTGFRQNDVIARASKLPAELDEHPRVRDTARTREIRLTH